MRHAAPWLRFAVDRAPGPLRGGFGIAGTLGAVFLAACTASAPLPAKAIELNRSGAAAIVAGDLETAEARVALALEYNARFTEAWVNLGTIEMMRGNFRRAGRDFTRARDLNPDLPAPRHALGLLAEKELREGDAEKHYRAALKVDPGFAPARANLARLLFARGNLQEAREQFLRLTQVAPDSVEGWSGLAETLLRLDRSDDALDTLARARERLGNVPKLALLEARFLLRKNSFAEAERRLRPLVALPDVHLASAALAWLAIARLGRGDAEGATESARRAIALGGDDGVARYALAAAHAAQESNNGER